MDRINELIAKGIENLTAEELAELRDLCHEEADARLDGDATDETLAELEQIAEHLDAVRAEEQRRAEVEAEKAEKKQQLADRIKGVESSDEGDEGDETDPEASAEGDEGETEAEGEAEANADAETETAPEGEKVPATVASSKPVVSRVAARRPDTHTPRRSNVRQAALVASANVPGVVAGAKLDSRERIHAAFDAAAQLAASSQTKIKLPVATLRADIPQELMLGRDPVLNEDRIAKRVGPQALLASGGICAPVPYRYDLPTVGDNARPVRDALARFGAERGGVRTLVPPTIADVEGAIGQWTVDTDEAPGEATKPYLTIACDDSETTTKVYAITRSFKVGNFRDRWFPEQIRAYLDLANTFQARFAESKLLATIASGSKNVTHGQVLGSAQDIFTSLDQLFMSIRFRHRLPRSQSFRVIGFEWVRDNIIADLIRKGPGDGTLEERLVMAETAVDAFFRARNVNITWSPDYEFGRTIGQAGGPPAGVQNGSGTPAIGYPSVARFYVHLEGSWLFLDGGQLDLGVIRDSSLVGTNDMLLFAETFENAHYHGVPGESYTYDIDICANGATVAADDIAVCVSGS